MSSVLPSLHIFYGRTACTLKEKRQTYVSNGSNTHEISAWWGIFGVSFQTVRGMDIISLECTERETCNKVSSRPECAVVLPPSGHMEQTSKHPAVHLLLFHILIEPLKTEVLKWLNPRHNKLNEAVKTSLNCDWKLPNRGFNYELAEFNYSCHH